MKKMIEMKKVIDYSVLHPIVEEVEHVVKKHGLDFVEQKLLYDILLERRQDIINKRKAQDMAGSFSLSSLFRKAERHMKGEDDEDVEGGGEE